MKERPWLKALIIIIVPWASALVGKFIVKLDHGVDSLFLGSLAIMLIWNLVFYIKKQLVRTFFDVIAFTLIFLLLMKLAFKNVQNTWQWSLFCLVAGFISNLISRMIMRICIPKKHSEEN